MLEELGKDLWNVALAGIGAVAIVGEKAYEFGKVCTAKGGETLEKGKAVSEDLRRKGEQIAQERREKYRQEALERLTAGLPVDRASPVLERYSAEKVALHRCEFCIPLK